VKTLAILLLLLLLTVMARADDQKPPVDIKNMTTEEIATISDSLLDYAMWCEEHDRTTFPVDMPPAGEPYDSVTGNRIKNVRTGEQP
jgi:hypothetical protein